MDLDTMNSPVISDSRTSSTRRTLLSVLGAGALAGGLAGLVEPKLTDARKKRKKKKGGKGNGGKGGGGGNGTCGGTVNGSAPASDEAALLQMINNFRQQNGGLPALFRQAQLDSAAAAHSRDMATHCYFDHVSPDGTDPFERMTASGYLDAALAENIYKGSGNLGSAAEAFDAWKNSPGHLTNMLNPRALHIGIGTALDGSGFMNWTNVFGRPRDI